jgi:hypothetical protein
MWRGQIVVGKLSNRRLDLCLAQLAAVIPAGDILNVGAQDLSGATVIWVHPADPEHAIWQSDVR